MPHSASRDVKRTETARPVHPTAEVGSTDGEPVDQDMARPRRTFGDDCHLTNRGDVSQRQGAPVLLAGVGVDCDFNARGETVEDVLRQCGEHARSAHGYADVPPKLVDQVKAAIRDEDATTAKA